MNTTSIYGLTFEGLTAWLGERGHRKFRASQVWDWLYKKRVTRFAAMEDVNPDCLRLLEEHFAIRTQTEHVRQDSVDGTVKFLLRLHDGNLIETVLMNHKFGYSVCVTTQVGCNIGCSFCASGLLAKSRDLTSGEIVEQIMHAQLYLDSKGQGKTVSHIVVMGIGEPFDNFKHMSDFIRTVRSQKGLDIAGRKITVSTSGLPAKIVEFADSNLGANLAISLHAPNDALRTSIMKINRAYPIAKLLEAMDYYLARTKRRVTLEYIMLKGVNDGHEHALELAELIGSRGNTVNVNLIPYNPVDEHAQYQRPEADTVSAFYDTLKKQGISVSKRLEHGTDIDAACGQLRSKQIKRDTAGTTAG